MFSGINAAAGRAGTVYADIWAISGEVNRRL